jgi:hypothetical protein
MLPNTQRKMLVDHEVKDDVDPAMGSQGFGENQPEGRNPKGEQGRHQTPS